MNQLYQTTYWLRAIVGIGLLPILIFTAAILHKKTRRNSTAIALIGLLLALGGTVTQLLSPFRHDVSPAMSWYVGSVVYSAGVIVSCIAFVTFVLTLRSSTNGI